MMGLGFEWSEFARDDWERNPKAWVRMPKAPPLTAAALFDSLAACCDLRAERTGVELRFFIANTPTDVLQAYPWLPKREDGGFEAYHRRVKAQLNGRAYALIVNNLELVDFPLWSWSRDFLAGLYRRVGMNKLGVYYALFVGDYARTPFGVHLDAESVFHFPVVGVKRIRTWPSEFVRHHAELRGATDYGHLTTESTLLEAGPGGAIYWPSDAWHIGESTGELSVSLALSLKCASSLTDALLRRLLELSPEINGGLSKVVPFDPTNLQTSAESVPQALRDASHGLRHLADAFDEARLWLGLVTSFGFLTPPRPRESGRISATSEVVGNANYPLVTLTPGGGQLLLSANGHVLEFDECSELYELVARVNLARSFLVRDVLKECSGQNLPIVKLWRVLDELYRIRAIECVDSTLTAQDESRARDGGERGSRA